MELEKHIRGIYGCTRCGVCVHKYNTWGTKRVCPIREHTAGLEPYSCRGRNQIARGVLEGTIELTPELAKVAYTCLLCGNCRQACGCIDLDTFKPLISQPDITKALRADLFAAGVEIPEGMRMFGENVEKTHNILGGPVKGRTNWLTPDIKVATDADTVFFPGCLAAYRSPEIAKATAKILNKAGIKFSILGEEEWCCGSPLIMTGQLRLAKKVAKHNVEQLKGKKVITACAGCARCFREEYPKLMGKGYELNLVHMVELLPELVESGKIKFKAHKGKKEIVTYHDPCELGRECGIYDQPRQVIQSIPGIELVEMERNRENTWCCGGGGGVKAANYALSLEIGKDKIPEALATGAKRVISACPSCKASINDAIRAMGKEAEIKAIDITELVAEAS
jgi:heterodisulfide reductase subunit D